ncbi:MAG: hypothetical protein WBZ31_10445 [Thiobacillus sp.]
MNLTIIPALPGYFALEVITEGGRPAGIDPVPVVAWAVESEVNGDRATACASPLTYSTRYSSNDDAAVLGPDGRVVVPDIMTLGSVAEYLAMIQGDFDAMVSK